MLKIDKFDVLKLKGKLGAIRNWMSEKHLPPRLTFYLLGIISTIWFLVRVIPKPSRASYPCMRVAAPFMSGFVLYILTLGGIMVALRKAKLNLLRAKYIAAGAFIFAAAGGMVFSIIQGSQNASALAKASTGPDDGPNQPIGTPVGINPGRVIWAWDKNATNENMEGYFYNPGNTDHKVVSKMVSESVLKLSGKKNAAESWDAIFHSFNLKKKNVDKGYTKGEKIFIKINQTSARGALSKDDMANGFNLRPSANPTFGTCQTGPSVVLEILRQLINEAGVAQEDISIGDPQNHVFGHNSDVWRAEFPNVGIIDNVTTQHGRTLIKPTVNELIFYSDKSQTDRFYDVIENADYMINVANFKPHLRSGITLTAKNHFGSHSRAGAYHLHYSHVSPVAEAKPTNGGYRKYRVFVDLMGSKYLGQNTLLFVVDGLFGGGASEGGQPVKYFMSPFNNDWSNSIFISQDQVALESVCYDFLRTEWNGTYTHDPRNARIETMPNVNGVDDYLHQAADPANWPIGITYDPDNSGKPLTSLGIHEHWNNPDNKQYSRNLGKNTGIELITIPSKIKPAKAKKVKSGKDVVPATVVLPPADVRPPASAAVTTENKSGTFKSVTKRPLIDALKGKKFYAAVVDDNNGKWFLTDAGIVNSRFALVSENIPGGQLNDLVYELSKEGPGLWIATGQGAVTASLPIEPGSATATFNKAGSAILSDSVLSVVIGRNNLRWFGTNNGISALSDKKWLTPAYMRTYPLDMFKDFPVTAMATSLNGDSLYVATKGAGITRVFKDKVDGISGASSYAQWGPIELPSDNVYSICIDHDSIQWFGTDMGVGKHKGFNTLENWTIYNTENGLINNFVQAIATDPEGKVWFGTQGGLSIFDGTEWISYTMKDGLISDNILSIVIDKNGLIYLGTDNGLMVYNDGALVCYQ